jgi:outer membrane receptor protein involved in Fe transport
MHPNPSHPLHRAKRCLAAGFAVLFALTVSTGTAADDSVQKLQQENETLRAENAELRRRFAEFEARQAATPAPAPAPVVATGPSASPSAAPAEAEPGVVVLSAFEVSSEKDFGYLKTNAATATRIGMEIQKVPMAVSVISRDFLDDTNSRSLMDLLRYTASASGDTRYAMRRPGNEATPQGAFTLRGFAVNTLMRNGTFRYISYNMDSVDRIEVVKGPAAVFFGQGYPGGVVNYITKQPSFVEIPSTFKYSVNDNSGHKAVADINVVLSKKAAFRMVGAWEDTQGERRFEFRRNVNLTPSLTFVPFDNQKLKINLDLEYLREEFNQNDYDWIWSDFAGWRTAAAATTAKVANSINPYYAGQQGTPSLAYATYINNKRIASGDYTMPAYTSVEKGAYYTNAGGQFIHDEAFNYTSRGARTMNDVNVFTTTVDFAPFDWLEARYVFQNDNSRFNNIEGVTTPYADGVHWNVAASATSGYYRQTDAHQLDLIFKFDLAGIKNKVLTGITRSKYTQNFFSNDIRLTPFYGHVPGSTNPIANPGYGTTGGTQVADNLVGEGRSHDTGVPVVNQVVRDRNGQIKLVRAVYSDFDPGFEVYPTIDKLFQIDRAWLDGYKPINEAAYINYQGMNWEFGAKISKDDGKLVGTLSFFRGERENQMLDDGARSRTSRSRSTTARTLFPVGSPYRGARLLRWRTTDLLNRIEGTEAEVIWTPVRNYQAVINGSWLWTAKTVHDKTRAAPGSTAYNASTPRPKGRVGHLLQCPHRERAGVPLQHVQPLHLHRWSRPWRFRWSGSALLVRDRGQPLGGLEPPRGRLPGRRLPGVRLDPELPLGGRWW